MGSEKELKYTKNDVIFTEMEFEKSMYLIKKGTVLIYRQTENNRIPIVTLKPGDWFGVPGFFLGIQRSVCAKSVSETTVLKISNTSELKDDLEQVPDWIKSSTESSMRILRATYDKILSIGDNIITIDYGAIKNKYLSQDQIYELLRALMLVELLLYRYTVEDQGVKLINNQTLKDILKKFFPKLSIGAYRFEKFLVILGVLKDPEREEIADFLQVGETYKLKAVINFITYASQKNIHLLQLPPQDVAIIELLIELGTTKGKVIKRSIPKKKEDIEEAAKIKREKEEVEVAASSVMLGSDPLLQEILDEELGESPSKDENAKVKSKIDLSVDKDTGIESKIRPDNRFINKESIGTLSETLVSVPEHILYDEMLAKTEYRGTINHSKIMAQHKIFERKVDTKSGRANLLFSLEDLADCMPFFKIINELLDIQQ